MNAAALVNSQYIFMQLDNFLKLLAVLWQVCLFVATVAILSH